MDSFKDCVMIFDSLLSSIKESNLNLQDKRFYINKTSLLCNKVNYELLRLMTPN